MKKLILLLLLFACSPAKSIQTDGKVVSVEVVATIREALAKDVPTVVMAGTTWCGACHIALPMFKRLALKHRNIQFLLIDADKIAIKLNDESKYPQAVPAFYVGKNEADLRSGQHILIGVESQTVLEKFILENTK